MAEPNQKLIEGVIVKPLQKIPDERGCIHLMMSNDDNIFEQFGQIYFSEVYPGVVKGWHAHIKTTLNYAVIKGMIKLVLYDKREDSPTCGVLNELFIGDKNYCLVHVPPRIINGFKGIGTKPALVANCSTHPYDENEILRFDPFDTSVVPYDWRIKHG